MTPGTTRTDMEDKNQILRNIPQVEKLLQSEEVCRFIPDIGRPAVADHVRDVLAEIRAKIEKGEPSSLEDIVPSVVSRCGLKRMKKLQRVINGTGVIIHTNLGRSPHRDRYTGTPCGSACPATATWRLTCRSGQRGRRGGFAEELLCAMHRRGGRPHREQQRLERVPHIERVRPREGGRRLPGRAGPDRRRVQAAGHHAAERRPSWSRSAPPISPRSTITAAPSPAIRP